MSKTTSITLGDHWLGFVEKQVSTGRYGSVSEVVRAGLRVLEERDARHHALQAAISAGLASGEVEDFDMESVQRELDES